MPMTLGSDYASQMDTSLSSDTSAPAYDLPSNQTVENPFMAAADYVFQEETFLSPYMNRQADIERDIIVEKMQDEGYDVDSYRSPNGSINYNDLVKDTNYPGLLDDEQVHKRRQDHLDGLEKNAQVAFQQAPVKAFGGAMLGAFSDPVQATTMLLGTPAAAIRGLTAAQKIGAVVGIEAGIGLVSEAGVQYGAVKPYKEELGRDYTHQDAWTAIALSAAFSGGFAGVVTAAGVGLAKALRASTKDPSLDIEETLVEDLEQLANELDNNPKRITEEQFKEQLRFVARMTNDELEAAATRPGRIGEIAERLIKARASVEERLKNGELLPDEVPPLLKTVERRLSLDEQKARDLARQNAVLPEYLEKLKRQLEELDVEEPRLKEILRNPYGKQQAELTRARNKLEGMPSRRNELETKINEAEQAEAAKAQGDTVTETREVPVWSKAAQQRLAEFERAAYEDDLIRSDLDWLREETGRIREEVRGREADPDPKSRREQVESTEAESTPESVMVSTQGRKALQTLRQGVVDVDNEIKQYETAIAECYK